MALGVREKLVGLLVGTAFLALLLACGAFVYYDRTSYSEAKHSTLSVLVQSVSQSAYGPTAFQDPDSARVILKVLEHEPSALAGAIYTQEGTLLADWSRNAKQLKLPSALAKVESPGVGRDRMHIRSAIETPEQKVGQLHVVFSTQDIKARTERFLQIAGSVLAFSVLLAFVLATLGQRILTRPVALLSAAAKRVQEHKDFNVRAERVSDDELGQLTDAFNAMLSMIQARDEELAGHRQHLEALVKERTRDLDQRNQEMRLVLDNVAQGFVTVDLHGVMASERSAIVDRWFGAPKSGATLVSYLKPKAPRFAEQLDMGLAELRDGIMPLELLLYQLPVRFHADERTFDASYIPIGAAESPDRLLVVLTDVTEALAHERAEREQKETVALFQRVASDRDGVEEFLTEAAHLVAALRDEQDATVQQRLTHTLKGNCAMYGMQAYSELAHKAESDLIESGVALDPAQRAELVDAWKRNMARMGWLLGGKRKSQIALDIAEVDALERRVQAGAISREILGTLADWKREPVLRRFERLARQVETVATRLGKPRPKVIIEDHNVRLEGDGLAPFWAAMVHVVRNAVDHGIEDAETRALAGKPEAGTISLSSRREHGQLVLSVRDDGRGVNWEKLREKAKNAGLPHASREDLVEALFCDGISTRDNATDVSGRGVGLAALRQVVYALAGTIEVESLENQGTEFRFILDERKAKTIVIPGTRVPRASLLPNLS